MQITRLRHYPAAQGYTHMRTHYRSPTEWTNRIPFKPNTRWNHTHYDSVFSGWVSAKSPGWWISRTVSHILLFCSSYLCIYKNTHVCVVMMMKRWRKKKNKKDWRAFLSSGSRHVQTPGRLSCCDAESIRTNRTCSFTVWGPTRSSIFISSFNGWWFWLWNVARDERTWQYIHKNGQDFQHI